ncbi:PAS domain-containing methyl-accepting chemotaxis protein [Bryobacter aggregatus]|uniref:methyl-accepting chemotaxis protein n=1 Tax=Bryobacter aggregatus TaxID=360054 RepID=UPI0006894CCA|nr:PAS domain-containing methyl-accepting chemotaxis protein [Bryobacter aggregatus]
MHNAISEAGLPLTTPSIDSDQELRNKFLALSRVQAMIEFTPQGEVISANEKFLELFGYNLDEIVGKHHRQFCDPAYVASAAYADLWEGVRKGEFRTGEFKRLGKNHREVYIHGSYNPLLNEAGKVYRVIKFATDVSQSREERGEIEATLRAVSKSQAVIEFNLDGTILKVNDNFLNVMGYEAAEVIGKHHRIFCEPRFSESADYQRFWQSLKQGEFQSGECLRIGKGGKRIWIQATYNPVFDLNDKVFKVVKFAVDVTAEKLRSEASESVYRAIEKSQAVIEFDLDGRIRRANDNFLSAVGYRLDEIEGRHHRMFCDDAYTASPAYQQFWEELRAGKFQAGRFKRRNRNGGTIWLFATYNPLLDEAGRVTGVAKVAADITAAVLKEMEMEESIRKVAGELNHQTADIAKRSATVAHGAQSLGATTEEMNASVEELTASINSIAETVRKATSVSKGMQGEADKGSKMVDKSIEAMDMITRSSEDIGDIVKVISEIASQTNLLAFNAAIEAARAGEQGLGFSVVADEVRKLAERSSQATREISKLIQESIKRIQTGSETSRQAAEAFHRIVSCVTETTELTAEISMAAEEQLIAAREVGTAIQHVAEQTEKSAGASEAIAEATKELTSSAEELYETLRKS